MTDTLPDKMPPGMDPVIWRYMTRHRPRKVSPDKVVRGDRKAKPDSYRDDPKPWGPTTEEKP